LILAGVEVAPAAFGLMIVEGAGRGTFWAQPTGIFVVIQIDVDLAYFQLQFYPLDLPRGLDSSPETRNLEPLTKP